MTVQLATLCDSAADYSGKLCVLGAFDTLCAREFPVVHPQCSFVVRLLFQQADAGRHQFTVNCLDPAGTNIMPGLPLDPPIDVVFPANFIPFLTRNIVLNLQRVRFERPGVYQWTLECDGKTVANVPLRVTLFDEHRSAIGPAG